MSVIKHEQVVCSKCGQTLALTIEFFHKNKTAKNGWNKRCKVCCGSKYGIPRKTWTEEENEIMHKHFPFMSNQELVDKYLSNRNVGQVSASARKLGLLKDPDYLYSMQVEKAMRHLDLIPCQKGEDSPRWNSVLVKCDNCGKEIYRTPYLLEINETHACSNKCAGELTSIRQLGENNHNYGVEWSDEQKQEARERAVKQLINSDFVYKETNPEKITREILEDINISHIQEYDCTSYILDFYLTDSHLMIEVNGNFFHCNPTMKLNNSRQDSIIRKDTSKNKYMKNRYGIETLYLWEKDLIERREMCVEMVKEYIDSNGGLVDYHSYNYSIYEGELVLNKEITNIGY